MILTVTPNPALDLTYRVPHLAFGQVNRVDAVTERAGGKGLNVARILASVGEQVCALAPVGGRTGLHLESLLDAEGVPHELTPVSGDTRRTVVVAGAAGATGLWEPGPVLTDLDWARFRSSVASRLNGAEVVVLSGSLPVGWPADAYAELTRLAVEAGATVILDADGPALWHGVAAGPHYIKPNALELAALVGAAIEDFRAAADAAARARKLGARDLVVSLGTTGLAAAVANETWAATPPARFEGNATGAGDAVVAALAVGVRRCEPWPERLVRMAAWSAAAAAHPVAGEFDADLAERLSGAVTVTQL